MISGNCVISSQKEIGQAGNFNLEQPSITLYHTIPIFNNPKKECFPKHCGKRKKRWFAVFDLIENVEEKGENLVKKENQHSLLFPQIIIFLHIKNRNHHFSNI